MRAVTADKKAKQLQTNANRFFSWHHISLKNFTRTLFFQREARFMSEFMGWPVIYEQIPGYIWLFNKFHNTTRVQVVFFALNMEQILV